MSLGVARPAAVPAADLSIRTVPDQRVAGVAEQLRPWVADTISDDYDDRLTIAEDRA